MKKENKRGVERGEAGDDVIQRCYVTANLLWAPQKKRLQIVLDKINYVDKIESPP